MGEFILQTGTAQHETGDNFEFQLAPNLDLFVIKKNDTGSNSTEISILSAASNYQSYILQTATPLHPTDSSFEFLVAPNLDVFAIKKNGTGTGSTEICVLSAESGYQAFTLQTGSPLHETDNSFQFVLAENRDLVGIKKNNTGSQTTELCILTAESNYQAFSLQTGTAQHETNDSYEFAFAANRDLFVIKKNGTGSGSTEVFAFSVASNYQEYILQTATPLHETDHTFTFEITPDRNLFVIKKSNTGTGSTEVSIIKLPTSLVDIGEQAVKTEDTHASTVTEQTDALPEEKSESNKEANTKQPADADKKKPIASAKKKQAKKTWFKK